jgi:hypothetical protein
MSNEFLNGLQAASNAVAGNVAGPVDILSLLLRKAGLPVPENAVGGSNWMTQKGLMAPVRQGASQVIGETAGLLGPAMVSQFGPQIARGLLKGGENLAAPRTLNPQTGAVVWHGSPHKFDKFDSSKIGTGEGAQAYGHGLYLAESPGVAVSYRNTLSAKSGPQNDVVQSYIKEAGGDRAKAAKALKEYVGYDTKGPFALKAADRANVDEMLEAILNPPGSLYKVDLPDEHIAKMLDWDKPLSQQSDAVKKAIGLDKNPNASIKDMTGLEFYVGTGGKLGEPTSASKAAAEHLRKKGILGIRYLDGGSRTAGTGTSNYVVFPGNEGLLKILERNGQPLP